MDKWQAQDAFWNSFGIPAYDENVDLDIDDIEGFNHITYQAMGGNLGQMLLLSASLWYKSNSWAEISQKADEILQRIYKGVVVRLDNGYFWLKVPENTPFAQRMDSGQGNIRRMYISIEAESLSNY